MIKDLFESKTFRGAMYGVAICLIILGIFQLGVLVGMHKAQFADRFGRNFERNFVGDMGSMRMGDMFRGGEQGFGGHGIAGKIISISLPSIVVSGPDNLEKTIQVQNDTIVRKFKEDIAVGDLRVGDFIVTLGSPHEGGYINAKLIRVMPESPQRDSGTVSPLRSSDTNQTSPLP